MGLPSLYIIQIYNTLSGHQKKNNSPAQSQQSQSSSNAESTPSSAISLSMFCSKSYKSTCTSMIFVSQAKMLDVGSKIERPYALQLWPHSAHLNNLYICVQIDILLSACQDYRAVIINNTYKSFSYKKACSSQG